MIFVLLHEQDTHALITSIANAYTSQYYEDKHEYDLLYEAVSLTFLGLYNIIKKSTTKMINGKPIKINNIGRVRIDTFDKPELFVYNLRAYIQHNILTDLARSYGSNAKHTESDTTVSDEDNESINKLDSMKYNKNNIESSTDIANSVANKITLKEDMHSLVNAVINRFCDRKPVAGYIYLSIMNGSYDPMTMVSDLKSKDFNQLSTQFLTNSKQPTMLILAPTTTRTLTQTNTFHHSNASQTNQPEEESTVLPHKQEETYKNSMLMRLQKRTFICSTSVIYTILF